MKKGKKRYWIPALMTLLVLAVVFGCFAGRLICAKAKLTSALNHVFSQLEERFQRDPIRIAAAYYDPEGKYTGSLEAITNQELLGTITCNLSVSINESAHQVSAEGMARVGKQAIDLSFYLDPNFMAVSSDELAAGEYYGITYDTFASDLRKIPLVDLIVSDALLERWNASLQEIQQEISKEASRPQFPEFQKEEIWKLLLGIAAMPCQIQKADIGMDEKSLSCNELRYTIGADQIGWVLSRLTGDEYESSTDGTVSFYLYEDALVRLSISGTAGETPFQYCADFGLDPLQNPLSLTGSYGTAKSLAVTVSTQSTENRYVESWDIHTVSSGKEQDHSFAFDWDSQSGALNYRSRRLSTPLVLNFQETGKGLRLKADDLGFLMALLLQEDAPHTSHVSGVLTLSRGAEIQTPSYQNLDTWSMQDFLTLLAGVGSLIGIRLE